MQSKNWVTQDKHVLASAEQPLDEAQIKALNRIYNEALGRCTRVISLLDTLESYLKSLNTLQNNSQVDIKQLIIDKGANPEIQETLKMIKRHFRAPIRNMSLQDVQYVLQEARKNLQKICDGLRNESVHISDIPSVMKASNSTLGYVNMERDENGKLKIAEGAEIHIDYRLLNLPTIKGMHTFIHESAHRYAGVDDEAYYFSKKLTKSKANEPINKIKTRNYAVKDLGYQIYLRNKLPNQQTLSRFRNIYIFTKETPSHLYYINDKGITIELNCDQQKLNSFFKEVPAYDQSQPVKNQISDNDFLILANQITSNAGHQRDLTITEALNNADSYAYFVCDLTESKLNKQARHKSTQLPSWWDMETVRPLHGNFSTRLIETETQSNNILDTIDKRYINEINENRILLIKESSNSKEKYHLCYLNQQNNVVSHQLTSEEINSLPNNLNYAKPQKPDNTNRIFQGLASSFCSFFYEGKSLFGSEKIKDSIKENDRDFNNVIAHIALQHNGNKKYKQQYKKEVPISTNNQDTDINKKFSTQNKAPISYSLFTKCSLFLMSTVILATSGYSVTKNGYLNRAIRL